MMQLTDSRATRVIRSGLAAAPIHGDAPDHTVSRRSDLRSRAIGLHRDLAEVERIVAGDPCITLTEPMPPGVRDRSGNLFARPASSWTPCPAEAARVSLTSAALGNVGPQAEGALLRGRLGLDGPPHRPGERVADRDHAVVGQNLALPALLIRPYKVMRILHVTGWRWRERGTSKRAPGAGRQKVRAARLKSKHPSAWGQVVGRE